MPKLIETHALTFSYYTENKEEILALDHIDFTLNQGEHVAIIGENGAGKSTFLQAIRTRNVRNYFSQRAGLLCPSGLECELP